MYQYKATVVKVVDGDTLDLSIDLGFQISMTERFRVIGLDTPERGQINFKEATELTLSMFPIGSTHIVETKKKDKYGRWLVELPTLVEAMNNHGFNSLANN